MECSKKKDEYLGLLPKMTPYRRTNFCHLCDKTLSPDEILSIVIRCVNFAARKHTKQRRKDADGTPYINHPIGVANILVQEANVYDPIVIVAALLHDTVEDTDTTFEEIEEEFGYATRCVVEAVTDDKTLPKDQRKLLQVKNTSKLSDKAKLVVMADKLYNLRDLQKATPVGWSFSRIQEYVQWSKAVVTGCRGINDNLDSALDEMFTQRYENFGKEHNENASSDTEIKSL